MKEIQHQTKRTLEALEIPNMVEIQLNSYNWFLQEGLNELFKSFSPIHDFTGNVSLEFLGFDLGEPKYSLEQCRYRDMTTYEAPIKARVRLTQANNEVVESEVYLGDLPVMTDKGTFVINGAERVVVSQLARSPGAYFKEQMNLVGDILYNATIIPSSGAWIDMETNASDVIHVHVAQSKTFPLTTLLRALNAFPQACPGLEALPVSEAMGRALVQDIVNKETGEVLFEKGSIVDARMARRLHSQKHQKAMAGANDFHSGLRTLLSTDPELVGTLLAVDVTDPHTGRVLAEAGSIVEADTAEQLKSRGVEKVITASTERGRGTSRLDTVVVAAESKPCGTTKEILDMFGEVETLLDVRTDTLEGRRPVNDIMSTEGKDVLVKAGQKLTEEQAKKIDALDLDTLDVYLIHPFIDKTLEEEEQEKLTVSNPEEALVSIFKRIRPGDPATQDSTRGLMHSYFFDTRRYDLATVGRYKVNKKLGLNLPENHKWVTRDDLVKAIWYLIGLRDAGFLVTQLNHNNLAKRLPEMEEVVAAREKALDKSDAEAFSNVSRLRRTLKFLANVKSGDIFTEVRLKEVRDLLELIPNGFRLVADSPAELYAETAIRLSPCNVDDIDHLENKRVRSVGELLQDQLRMGFLRMEKVAKERMTSLDPDNVIPQVVLSVKPISASIKSFFGSSQLSQFMDMTNPLAELAHKRRLSALGPGGLSRQSAKLEVRDVHHSHYGRICPIETPEGPNIGLIGSLAIHARIDDYGFIRTPYLMVKNGKIVGDIVYMSADEETQEYVAPAHTEYDPATGELASANVVVRHENKYPQVLSNKVTYMEVSPMQIMSVAASLIPFLENDDANRALMGSNMQRQAVPLLRADAPIVRTGIEKRAAKDSGAMVLAKRPGVVVSSTADCIKVKVKTTDSDTETVDEYNLLNLLRSNQGTCITQRPVANVGDRVRRGDLLADGPCTDNGELALGCNILVAFMAWNGYNYEDAILLSERLIKDDVFTSIHVEKFETEARDTKLGPEEITRDIPNVGEDILKDLDENGVVRVGADVRPEDILVGKVAPKGQGELTAEERLIIAIFGKKAEETRDVSLRVPHGEGGTVVEVKVFSRFKYTCINEDCKKTHNFSKKPESLKCEACDGELKRVPGDELSAGVNQLVRIYVAQKRKIMEGDKMAGRHGNKGVISKILPEADMPYMPDGTPVDVVLNPLGVPSRMNIGQILETHQGLAGHHLGCDFKNPIFQGATEDEILADLATVVWKLRLIELRRYVRELELDVKMPTDRQIEGVIKKITARLASTTKDNLTEVVQPVIDLFSNTVGVIGDHIKTFDSASLEMLSCKLCGPVAVDDPEALWQASTEKYKTVTDDTVETESQPEELLDFAGSPPDPDYDHKKLVTKIVDNVHRRCGLDEHTGKCALFDGRTGERFRQDVTIGHIYMLKLVHLVEDKIHARSTGPYSLVTQQPLGGKAQFGGQRFGEMEVWALEAYGAAHTLQEILTIKSDDVQGRVKTYEAIVKGENIMEPGVPESFKILVNEMQSLGLKVAVEDESGKSIDLRESEDEPGDHRDGGIISSRRNRRAEELKGGF